MIQKDIIKQAKSLVEVTVTVPWVDLEPKWNETLQKLAAEMEISGFRKGTAPLPMVEGQLGQRLQDEVLKQAQPAFLIESLKGSDIIPIDYPKYQLISFNKGAQLQYKAIITDRPKVSVGNYKSIKITKPAVKPVSEEEISKVIDDLYKRWKARQPVNQSSDQNTVGASGSINLQQPQSPTIPPQSDGSILKADDSFAKAMGAVSLDDLKTKVRKDLEANVNLNNELDFEEAILQEVANMTQVEIPDILIEDELNRMLVSLQRRVADMGLLLDDYLRTQKKTVEGLKVEWRPQAEKNVKMELGLADIARAESVTISDDELQKEIDKIQDARVKQQFQFDEPKLQLKHALRQTRTLDLLKKIISA